MEVITQGSLFSWTSVAGEVATSRGNKSFALWSDPEEREHEAHFLLFFEQHPELISALQQAQEVWIKPNLTSAEEPAAGKTTQPSVLRALITTLRKVCEERKNMYVADSSVIGSITLEAAACTGILEVCRETGVLFKDLRDVPFMPVRVPNPSVFAEVPISMPFASSRTFKINLAKIKSTYGSPAGFCVKNNKGVITDAYKNLFHQQGLQRALCDLQKLVCWDLAVLEGVPISELGVAGGIGPTGVSTSEVVIDLLIAWCLRVPIDKVEHLRVLAERYGINLAALGATPGLEEFRGPWKQLRYTTTGTAALAGRYGIAINDGEACSACVESLAKACARLTKAHNLAAGLCVVMGAGRTPASDDDLCASARQTFLGRCALDRVGMLLHDRDYDPSVLEAYEGNPKINGCPPTIDDMVRGLARDPSRAERDAMEAGMRSQRLADSFDIDPSQTEKGKRVYQRLLALVPGEQVCFNQLGLETALACETFAAAICHRINWDFLRQRLLALATTKPESLRPEELKNITSAFVGTLLQGYQKTNRIRAHERARLLRSLVALFDSGCRTYTDVFRMRQRAQEAEGTLSPVLERLQRAHVFAEDPERKKVQVLLHNLSRAYPECELGRLCQPAVDYHIMRLYVRRGDVYPRTRLGEEYIFGGQDRRAVTVAALRSVVAKALKAVSEAAAIPVQHVNNIEWWIGRSVCTTHPDCHLTGPHAEWLRSGGVVACPFQDVCWAFTSDKRLLEVQEPKYEGSHY